MQIQRFKGGSRKLTGVVMACLLAATGCGRTDTAASEKVFEMGTPTSVGALSYNVIDASWREALVTSTGPRVPTHRFLVLNLSVTNGGAGTLGVPLLTLVGADGKEYREEDKGEGVSNWMGTIRMVDPALSGQGNILFDVPPGTYKLRVSSGGDPEKEQTALINIPLRVDPPSAVGGGDSVEGEPK